MTKLKHRMRIIALFSIIVAGCILATSCPGAGGSYVTRSTVDPLDLEGEKLQPITVTVQADSNITVKPPATFQAETGDAWYELKDRAQALLQVKSGYSFKGWKKDGSTGQALNDNDVFTANVTVYAESAPLPADPAKKVTITIKGSAHVTVSNPATIVGV